MGNRRGRVPREVSREREKKAWEYRQQLWTQDRIAEELGVTRVAVTKMLQRVEKRNVIELDEKVTNHKLTQIEQLQAIADQAVQAWERSKESTKTVSRIKKGPAGEEGPETTIIKMQDMDGDPRFLTVALTALTDLRKIMGLDAPHRSVQTQVEVKTGLSDEKLASLENIMNAARERKEEKEKKKSKIDILNEKLDSILEESFPPNVSRTDIVQ